RAIFWAAVGVACLVMLARSSRQRNSDGSTHAAIRVGKDQEPAPEPQKKKEPAGRAHIAVVLAKGLYGCKGFGSSLPNVGTLPVLLRAILGAQKAGAARIVVVADRLTV